MPVMDFKKKSLDRSVSSIQFYIRFLEFLNFAKPYNFSSGCLFSPFTSMTGSSVLTQNYMT